MLYLGADLKLKDNFIKNMSEKKQVLMIRVLVVVFIIISAVIAMVQYKSNVTFIAQLMGISWGALAGAFLAPFLYSLYWKGVTKASVFVSFICGVGIMCTNMFCTFTGRVFISEYFTSPINAGMLAMLVGLVVVPIVSFITKAPAKEKTDNIFTCYDKTVTVKATTALTDK